jgi:osmotically-inducible protein OsmY
MKLFNRSAVLSLGLVLSVLVGCANTPTQQGTGAYFDDAVITSKVKAAMLNEPTLSSTQIGVETFKGKVQLSGFVATESEVNTAGEVALAVNGVTSVKNDLRLR